MQIFYPYNEILPKKKAHDVFIFHECAALAKLGWDVTLLCGRGSDSQTLFEHYQTPPHFHIEPLPIVRKNNPLNISWNFPFFYNCQRLIRSKTPDYVFLSVRKQGAYHLSRKLPGIRYLYEVHELCSYPNQKEPNGYELEKKMLSQADLITVTTTALKEILETPPYSLKVPIEVVPLAVQAQPLPPPSPAQPLTLMYVGQLYAGQGMNSLLSALAQVEDVHLKVVGGTTEEISHLSKLTKALHMSDVVEFLGFIPPAQLPSIVKQAHAFVAPFDMTGRMPYVAHTKLYEYAQWGRPIIAPNVPIVTEHFHDGQEALLFQPGDISSLADKINVFKDEDIRLKLQKEISAFSERFTWEKRAQHYKRLLS